MSVKIMAASEASLSFETKTSLFCAIFARVFDDKTPNGWKNQVRCKCFPLSKNICRKGV